MWRHVDRYVGTNVAEDSIASISRQSQNKWYQLLPSTGIYVTIHTVSYQRRMESVYLSFASNQVKWAKSVKYVTFKAFTVTMWAVSHATISDILVTVTVSITRDWCGEKYHYTYVTVQLVSSGQGPIRTRSNSSVYTWMFLSKFIHLWT